MSPSNPSALPFPHRPALRARRAALLLAAIAASGSLARSARAQQLAAPAVELRQFQGSPFSDRTFRLDGPGVLPAWRLKLGVEADYALKPLVVTLASPAISAGGQTSFALVHHAAGANVSAAIGLADRLELAVLLPVTAFQTGDPIAGVESPARSGLEAVRVGVKVHILGEGGAGFGLGAAVLAAIPTGSAGGLIREDGLGGEGRLFAAFRTGALSAGAGAGYRLRRATQLYDVPLGNELTAAAGAELRLLPNTSVLAEVAGATTAQHPLASAKQSPLEALLGLRQRLTGGFTLFAAAGPGLVEGYGTPLVRAVAGVGWSDAPTAEGASAAPPARDSDGDGIPDAADNCPNEPEDKDGFQDQDGCPDPDNDKDGIPDKADKCPNQPETKNGYKDDDGCPDKNLHALDTDGDGIMDDVDKCPNDAEDKDGFEDDDGCPDLDNDKDGIPDKADKCPNEPETINNVQDEDGCPDKGLVQLRENELETLTPIFFDTDRARVRHAFRPPLNDIAAILKAHPEIGRCAVEGHTDATGPAEWNQKLSLKRAQAVVTYLVGKGVDAQRLIAIGQGDALPWASNSTAEGRAANRRVIFHIEGGDADQDLKQLQVQKQRAAKRLGSPLDAAPEPPAEPIEKGPPIDRPGDSD